ncbi:MAG: PilN domain-containing protein [Synergistaceae bacterium]|jgi:Tfp pilus assembly protein PilN|nr:PilN domain-containing protein [Synergistaceae bacterium]
MQVLFDLRPQHLVQVQDQKFDLMRVLVVVLFVGFVVVSIFNIANMMLRLRGLNAELDAQRAESSSVGASISNLDTKIATFREARERIRAYLEFTRQDLPTVEFLSGLEGAVNSGLKVTNLDIRQGSVTLRGSGITDQDVMDFVNGLDSMKYMITKVDPPSMTKSTLNNVLITDFALSCNIKSVTAIGEALPDILNIRTTPAEEMPRPDTEGQAPVQGEETPVQ